MDPCWKKHQVDMLPQGQQQRKQTVTTQAASPHSAYTALVKVMTEFIKKDNREAGDGSVVKSAWCIYSPKSVPSIHVGWLTGELAPGEPTNAWSSGLHRHQHSHSHIKYI